MTLSTPSPAIGRDDLKQADPDSFAAYLEKFPQIDAIPTFGGYKDGTFDIEQAVSLNPDVMILNLEAKVATDEAGHEEKLAAVGIPIVYDDFRESPLNIPPSRSNSSGNFTARKTAPPSSTPSSPRK
ncbi:hypothetical protein ACSBLW_18465 [Thioclava sp. FR2]|uniref:hypothetical protein n=1 Tax=Thioclava sp. FR2 TaxID=3445780 RepID=UPI003EB6CB77